MSRFDIPEDHDEWRLRMQNEIEDFDNRLDRMERFKEWDHQLLRKMFPASPGERLINRTFDAMEDEAA